MAHRDANGPFTLPQGAQGRGPARPEGVRAVRGLPADPGRGRPAGRVQRAPGGVSRWCGAMVKTAGGEVASLIGNAAVLRSLKPADFVDETFGLPTVTDILRELEKPGRDPRPAFKTATFKEGVEKIGDLASGMVLEGVVTNVAAFGAFVDVGVHQDGLVHVSAMSKTFVKDPRDVVKPGDIVKVKVLDVDIPRKRISLTLRLDDEAARRSRAAAPGGGSAGAARRAAAAAAPAAAAATAAGGGGGQRGGGSRRRPRAGEQRDGGRAAAGAGLRIPNGGAEHG